MKILNLDILVSGLPGISATRGAFYREATIVGLKKQGFDSGVVLQVEGEFQELCQLIWTEDVSKTVVNSWRDEVQIANFGAVGIALVLMVHFLDFQSFEEGIIGTGIDFWLSRNKFQEEKIAFRNCEARLEVSGILTERPGNTVNMRVGKKKVQMTASDESGFPGWIVVVEFSIPKSKIVKK